MEFSEATRDDIGRKAMAYERERLHPRKFPPEASSGYAVNVTMPDAPLGRAVQRFGSVVAILVLGGLHYQYVRILPAGSGALADQPRGLTTHQSGHRTLAGVRVAATTTSCSLRVSCFPARRSKAASTIQGSSRIRAVSR